MTSYQTSLKRALSVFDALGSLEPALDQAAARCLECLRSGGKILTCGNGGSAAEAQHLVGELLGHYLHDRVPLPAVALTADSALLTCIANDYSYEDVFSRQLRALAKPGDIVICFTTSGNSKNVLATLAAARQIGVRSIAFLGAQGGKAMALADDALLAPARETGRVQEVHQFLLHCLMDQIETGLGFAS